MMRLVDDVWMGGTDAIKNIMAISARGVLNVAVDLAPQVVWPKVEYAQIGLVDGPGNEPADYCAAILILSRMRRRCERVLLYDHEGSRAVAVGVMYLCLTIMRDKVHPTCMRTRPRWDDILEQIDKSCGMRVPRPHEAHREAFERLPYGLLEVII